MTTHQQNTIEEIKQNVHEIAKSIALKLNANETVSAKKLFQQESQRLNLNAKQQVTLADLISFYRKEPQGGAINATTETNQ
jgi:ssRNA-specific RNase YbeY (16S rRNA maturation enzyme)